MKKWFKTVTIMFVLLMLMLTMCSCWDKRELAELAVILGCGVDLDESGKLSLTIEVVHATSEEQANESMIYQASGYSLNECLYGLKKQLDKELLWDDLAVIIFGDSLDASARQYGAFICYQELKNTGAVLLLRSKGPAGAIFSGKFGEADFVSQGLADSIKLNDKHRSGSLWTVADYLEKSMMMIDINDQLPKASIADEEVKLEYAG